MTQKNSFISLLEKIAMLNKNNMEVLTKLNDVVGSNKNSINVNYQEEDGRISTFQLPTVGFLKSQIDIANSNIKKLATIEGDNSVIIIDENTSRKIKSVDLNREPSQITNLNIVSNFSQNTNWFFEGLMNPLLNVQLDLSGQIKDNVNKVLSRRYILQFEKNDDGTYTTNGQDSLTYFENNFLNRNDFTIETFLSWINNPTNLGVLNTEDENLYRDEQYFDLNYKEINYKGYFSVLKLERDSLNNKLWYHLNTLTYYDRNGNGKSLAIGDTLSVTSQNSYTKYKILEINTSSSLFRISVERIEGYDPIPIGVSTLEYYSNLQSQTTVKISIGFDEYNVVFVKPINTDNSIICASWSRGMAFYSNDLVLDTDNNVAMADFYLNYVYDYGALLKDMVAKRIPSQYGSKPNKPNLISDNFKVVQINKHLTDTKDYKTLKKLHAQKNATKSKLSEVENAITQKNVELNTKVFKSVAEKTRAQNELNKLIQKQESDTKLYSSYVSQITNSRAEETAEPKFRVRGFWDMPDPILKSGYRPQEVIGFEIQYRYGSKFGTDNTTDGFELKKNVSDLNALTSDRQQYTTQTAYFSQWIAIKTDIRKRSYDSTTGKWYWEIEDVSDADTPNINQLDIPIQRTEKVEIRIRSISEVGYPDAPIYSDWCDLLTMEFPDNLNEVLGENAFILQDATREEMRVSFENELSSKGVLKHVGDSFYVNEQYFAHNDKTIATSFKDTFGNTLTLFDYLKQMNDKISALEESIKRAKGELKLVLYKGTEEIEIINGSTVNIVINCEDYMIQSSGVTTSMTEKSFQNNIYLVQDYYLQLQNIAKENDLGLLSSKTKTNLSIDTLDSTTPSFINDDGSIYQQSDNQYIWLEKTANIDGTVYNLYSGDDQPSYLDALTNSGYTNISAKMINKLLDTNINTCWKDSSTSAFGATAHPYIKGSVVNNVTNNTLVDKNIENLHIIGPQVIERIPIQIYFKPALNNNNTFTVSSVDTPAIIKKALRFLLDEESRPRSFEFTVIFKLIRHKQYATSNYNINTSTYNTA